MGYNISVGETEIVAYPEELYMKLDVGRTNHPDAPDHCPYTGKGNSRSPSYSAWSDFCEDAGIYELFYGVDGSRSKYCSDDFYRETPLLANHPGIQLINQADVDYIRDARIRYEFDHPDSVAGFWETDKNGGVVDESKDPILARLLWLEFWFDWAVKNCKLPAIANS